MKGGLWERLDGEAGKRGRGIARLAGRERAEQDSGAQALIDAAEHLTRDLARVRAKFGMDPVLAPPSFSAAWQSDTPIEEAEAEFVDTVADCLGAGLSLEDALTCWDTGDLACDPLDDQSAVDPDDEPVASARTRSRWPAGAGGPSPPHPLTGHAAWAPRQACEVQKVATRGRTPLISRRQRDG